MPNLFRRPQPETIEEYTEALRRRLAGVLPLEKIDEVVVETRAHLDDVAQDLRRQPDRFEREAVRRFVPAHRLAGGIARAWAPTYLRHRATRSLQNVSFLLAVLCLVEVLIVYSASGLLRVRFGQHFLVPLALFLPFPCCFFLASLACRPQPRRFVALGLAACLLGALWGGMKCTRLIAGGYISRFDAPAALARETRTMSLRHEEVALLQQGVRHAWADAPRDERLWPAVLRSSQGILLPRGYDYGGSAFHCDGLGASRPVLWYTDDPAKAERAWRRNGRAWLGAHIRAQADLQNSRAGLMRLMAEPRTRFDPTGARWVGNGMLLAAGLLLLADLLGGTLGAALLRAGRRWRRRTA